jgi:hypothetical protein
MSRNKSKLSSLINICVCTSFNLWKLGDFHWLFWPRLPSLSNTKEISIFITSIIYYMRVPFYFATTFCCTINITPLTIKEYILHAQHLHVYQTCWLSTHSSQITILCYFWTSSKSLKRWLWTQHPLNMTHTILHKLLMLHTTFKTRILFCLETWHIYLEEAYNSSHKNCTCNYKISLLPYSMNIYVLHAYVWICPNIIQIEIP